MGPWWEKDLPFLPTLTPSSPLAQVLGVRMSDGFLGEPRWLMGLGRWLGLGDRPVHTPTTPPRGHLREPQNPTLTELLTWGPRAPRRPAQAKGPSAPSVTSFRALLGIWTRL